MQIIRYILASFSMFSAVPVRKELTGKDFKYTAVCLPLVGAVMGGVLFMLLSACLVFHINNMVSALIICLLPPLFTGGIHLDGFMDCHDAFASHADREKMLTIMKDSSIGAFACLYMVLYELVFFVMSFIMPKTSENLLMLIVIFSLSRMMSAYALLKLPNARTSGMGKALKEASGDNKSKRILLIEGFLIFLFAIFISFETSVFVFVSGLISYFYCTGKMKKLFGGITGDLAGWMLSCCEIFMLFGLNIATGGIL